MDATAATSLPQQQRRDQKAAEGEEQIDPDRALAQDARQQARRGVVPNDRQDGETAQPVQAGQLWGLDEARVSGLARWLAVPHGWTLSSAFDYRRDPSCASVVSERSSAA